MAPDCESPKCHEAMKLCIDKKVPKRTLWIACWAVVCVIMIPLFITGVQVWSEQDSNALRFAGKDEVQACKTNQSRLDTIQQQVREDIKSLVKGQEKLEAGQVEILRYLRKE